jgi:phosphohistidine phosphatase
MTDLLLLRHGTAEDRAASGADADRDLTAKGEGQARAAGVALAALGLRPDVVLASPKVRAWRTALLACEALGGQPVEHQALVGLDRDEALLAAGFGDRVLLVGHEPDLSQTVHDLTGARIRMRKAAVALVAVDGSRGELRGLLGPDVLARVRG